jgi:demethylmenaquinone methyltransferase/2-methoxy-6-polyprenyl-1,4-benzoquinol methylase
VTPRFVRALFQGSYRTYDLLNHLFSLNIDRSWRALLVRMARLPPAARVLDAACGTGDLAVAFARGAPGCRVAGVDFAAHMVRRGRRKLARLGLRGRISLEVGDVLQLPFQSGSFDAVGMAFGLRNIPERERAVAEMLRVLKPGGRLLVLEFVPPARTLAGRLYRLYLGRLMPLVGGLVSGSFRTYRYLYASVAAFLTPPQLASLLVRAGLESVRLLPLTWGIACLWWGRRPGGEAPLG